MRSVSRTMIILDPDLEPDRSLKRSAAPTQRAQSRDNRIPSARVLTRFLLEAHAAVKLRGEVSVLLTTDKAIRRLNRQFRGKDKATDVLSFPALTHISKTGNHGAPAHDSKSGKSFGELRAGKGAPTIAGDLAVSVDTARKQAAALGHALAIEIKVLMLHGLLHLAGYDHETDEGEMARREESLRAKLRLPHGLIERTEASEARVLSSPTRSAMKLRNGWGTQSSYAAKRWRA
jgi:probable rRNA maturation factor